MNGIYRDPEVMTSVQHYCDWVDLTGTAVYATVRDALASLPRARG